MALSEFQKEALEKEAKRKGLSGISTSLKTGKAISPKEKPAKKPVKVKSDAVGGSTDPKFATSSKEELEQTSIALDNKADKDAVKDIKAFANKNTSFDNASQFLKPIALLDYYTPYIKAKIFYPKKTRGGGYVDVGIFDTESLKSEVDGRPLIQNNYIESFTLGSENNMTFTMKIVDSSLDFTDSLLMRFGKEFQSGLKIEIFYGWSNKEKKQNVKWNGELKPVYFTNGFLGHINTIEVDENIESKRTVTITGFKIDKLPGELSTVTPYNELGPYPMMTYQFIKFLSLDEKQMRKIIELASAFVASEPEKGIQKGKDKAAKEKLKAASVLGSNTEKIETILTKFHAVKKGLKEKNANDPRIKFLESITASASSLDVKKVEDFYINKSFNLRNLTQANDAFGTITEELMRRFTTIIRDIRIHPWQALKYVIEIMYQKMQSDGGTDFEPIIINDFVGVLQQNDNFKVDLKLKNNYDIVGWADWDKMSLDKLYESNEALRMIGILPSDIAVDQNTSWASLLNLCASKCMVYAKTALDVDKTSSEVAIDPITKLPKKLSKKEIEERTKAKDADFTRTFKAGTKGEDVGKLVVDGYAKAEPLKIQMFSSTKETALDILQGIKLVNDSKAKLSFRSFSENNNLPDKTNQEAVVADLATNAKIANIAIQKTIDSINNKAGKNHYIVINIYGNKQAQLFDNNFAKQNILQAYSYRFQTQNEYAYNFNPGMPSLKLINFPDTLNFKPNIGNIIQYLTNIIQTNRNLKIEIPDGKASNARITSSDKDAIRFALEEKTASLKTTEKEDAKGEDAIKEKNKKIKELRQSIAQDKEYLNSSIISDPNLNAKYNNPIYLDMKVPLSFLHGNGKNNNDVGILKNNIVNFRKRFVTSSASQYEATLDIMGDASYNEITNLQTSFIFVRAYNPDGSDSMHTGLYRIVNWKHDITSGSFKTSLSLRREPKPDNENLLRDLNNIVFADSITKEQSWSLITDKLNTTDAVKKAQQDFRKQKQLEGLSNEEIDRLIEGGSVNSTDLMGNTLKGAQADEKTRVDTDKALTDYYKGKSFGNLEQAVANKEISTDQRKLLLNYQEKTGTALIEDTSGKAKKTATKMAKAKKK